MTNFYPINKVFDYSIMPCFNFSDTYFVKQEDVSKYDEIMKIGIIQLEVVTWEEKYPVLKYGEEFVKKAETTRNIYENYQADQNNFDLRIESIDNPKEEKIPKIIKTVALLEFSEQEGLLKLSKEIRISLNIPTIKFQIFDNDRCIGSRLTRLILMTTNDFNAYLYKMIEDFISYRTDFFPRKIKGKNKNKKLSYDFFVHDRMKNGRNGR